MRSLSELPTGFKDNIRYILTDIDDTLTEDGKLGPEVYKALWRLHEAGYILIPVTGGPAGWCDMIVRLWPVDAVIGENGAFTYYFEDSKVQTLAHPSASKDGSKEKLEKIFDAVLEEIPEARQAQDQFSRIFDFAIDYNQTAPKLGYETAERIKKIYEQHGANARISSIHVNTWIGNYSKREMAVMFMKERYGISEQEFKQQALYCGDAPNDEPMFDLLPNSFAVANILEFSERLISKPAWVATGRGGSGFVEIAEKLL